LVEDLIAESLGKYRMLGQVGRGGMGVVYKALDTEKNTYVAIKTVPPDLAHHPEFLKRFQQEARALMRLHHPHIVGLIDLFQDQGNHCMVLEYVDGPSLSQLLAKGPLLPERAQEIALQVADALSHAHAHNIVHRDIKPSNILLTREGEVKVTDFGIARILDATLGTLTGQVFGTARYASPEQVKGLKVDRRSDIYSLGVVLYEMLTGRPPFVGTDDEVMEQHNAAQPVPPTELNEGVPASLEAITLRCLDKDRNSRYQRAEDLAADLRGAKVGTKPGVGEKPQRGRGKRQPMAAFAAITAIVLVALFALAVVIWPRLVGGRDGTMAADVSDATPSHQPSPTATNIEAPASPAETEPPTATTAEVTVGPTAASTVGSAPSPGRIAFSSNNVIVVVSVDGEDEVRLTESEYPACSRSPSWSPDATKIAFISCRDGNDEIYVMNADGTVVAQLTNLPTYHLHPAWSPNGTSIAFVSARDGNEEIYVMNADGTDTVRLTNNPGRDFYPSWSPDGSRIAFVSDRDGNEEIYLMDDDGSRQVNLTSNERCDNSPSWSPDGSRIAFASWRDGTARIYVVDPQGNDIIRLTNGTVCDLEPAWSPDGERIAFSSYSDFNWEIYVVNVDGSGVTRLTNNPANDVGPSWSPS
jgi:Tol biopolymer transport system component